MATLTRILERLAVPIGTGCWEWTGARVPGGYGSVQYEGRTLYVHRVLWREAGRELLPRQPLDHLCRNKICANPDHLRAATHRQNLLASPLTYASINAAKTHCLRGHEFDEANTAYVPAGRQCRRCRSLRSKARREAATARRKAAAAM